MSSKSSNKPDLANLPYDPNLCAKRMWNGGWGCQCQKAAADDGMCSRHLKMMNDFGGFLPHGFYNEERPLFDLTRPTTRKHAWKSAYSLARARMEQERVRVMKSRTKNRKMRVADVRNKLEEFGLDTTGKKPELLKRLNDYMAEPPPKEVLTLANLHYAKIWRGKNSSALKWWRQYTNEMKQFRDLMAHARENFSHLENSDFQLALDE